MTVPPLAELEKLLDDDRWIRRLARRLVADPGAADDLAQETWVAALGSREGGLLATDRPWLGRALRNSWKNWLRGGARREHRERNAARDEGTPAADELVAELELRERIARALRALEEPYRSTLFLRFFRDESLAAIARQEDVAVSTVHERIERGLARLRARLDGEHGGRRDAWAGALITLAAKAGKGAGTLEVVTMAGVLKVAASVVVLGAGAAWWWSEARPEAAAGSMPPGVPAPASEESAALLASEPQSREEIAATPEATVAPAPVVPAERAMVRGRVLDVHGGGVGAVELGWRHADADDEPARSGSDGSFELAHSKDEPAGSDRIICRSPELITLVSTESERETRIVVVAPRASFAGTVVDEAGASVVGAELFFRLRETLFRETGVHAFALEDPAWSTASDERGRFELADVAGGANVFLAARAAGFEDAEVALDATGSASMLVTLRHRERTVELTGVVLDPAGAPVPGAKVSAGKTIVTTDPNGEFALIWDGGNGHVVQDEQERWGEQGVAHASVIALKEGFLPAEELLRDRDLAEPFVLTLGPAPFSIRGVVLDPARKPVAGLVVWVPELTRFGQELDRLPDGNETPHERSVESELGGEYEAATAITGADGSFELLALMRRSYALFAFDPRTASRRGPWTIEAGASGVELEFRLEPTKRVAGRVVTARGTPRAGLSLRPKRVREVRFGADAPLLHGAEYGTKTDAEGRFEFEQLATEGTWLFLEAPFLFREIELASFTDLEHLEIVEPEACEVQVELADPGSADLVRALDPSGAELETMEVTGNERMMAVSMGTEAQLVDGRSRLLLIKETARTLVLYKAGVEVLRYPVRLEPGQRNVIRP